MNSFEKKDELKPFSRKYSYEQNTDRLTRSSLDALFEAVRHNDILLRQINEGRLKIVRTSDVLEVDAEFDFDPQSSARVRQKK